MKKLYVLIWKDFQGLLSKKILKRARYRTLHSIITFHSKEREKKKENEESVFVFVGNSLVIQWLGLGAFSSRGRVHSLVGELRSCKPHSTAKICICLFMQTKTVAENRTRTVLTPGVRNRQMEDKFGETLITVYTFQLLNQEQHLFKYLNLKVRESK